MSEIETLEIEQQMKTLESWLDKTSELLLSEADNLTDISDCIVKIIATKREEYARLGFKKESIQTQINRVNAWEIDFLNLKAFLGSQQITASQTQSLELCGRSTTQ